MTTFETIDKHETEFENERHGNAFVQVARKMARNDDDGDTEFVVITRGYVDEQGSRRYKTNITLPPNPDLIEFVTEALNDVAPASIEERLDLIEEFANEGDNNAVLHEVKALRRQL